LPIYRFKREKYVESCHVVYSIWQVFFFAASPQKSNKNYIYGNPVHQKGAQISILLHAAAYSIVSTAEQAATVYNENAPSHFQQLRQIFLLW